MRNEKAVFARRRWRRLCLIALAAKLRIDTLIGRSVVPFGPGHGRGAILLHSLRAFAISVCARPRCSRCRMGTRSLALASLLFGIRLNSATANGWLIGGHAGYNWQQGSAVFGFETDLQGTDLHSSMQGGLMYPFPVSPPFGDFARTASGINWYGTLPWPSRHRERVLAVLRHRRSCLWGCRAA